MATLRELFPVERLNWSFPRVHRPTYRFAPPPFNNEWDRFWIRHAAGRASREWVDIAHKGEWTRIDPACFRLAVFDKTDELIEESLDTRVVPCLQGYKEYIKLAHAFTFEVYDHVIDLFEREHIDSSSIPPLETDVWPFCHRSFLLNYSVGDHGNFHVPDEELVPIDPADFGRFDPNALYREGKIKVSTFTLGWNKFNKEYDVDDDGNPIVDGPGIPADSKKKTSSSKRKPEPKPQAKPKPKVPTEARHKLTPSQVSAPPLPPPPPVVVYPNQPPRPPQPRPNKKSKARKALGLLSLGRNDHEKYDDVAQVDQTSAAYGQMTRPLSPRQELRQRYPPTPTRSSHATREMAPAHLPQRAMHPPSTSGGMSFLHGHIDSAPDAPEWHVDTGYRVSR